MDHEHLKHQKQYNRLVDIQCIHYLAKHFDVTAYKHDWRYKCPGVVPIGNVTIDFTKTLDGLVSLYKLS